jgi:excisionase family DNA binding protein
MATVMTLEEVAEFLRVHPSTVYRLLKGRNIPAFKVGSDWRFNIESIEKWVVNLETAQGPAQSLPADATKGRHPAGKRRQHAGHAPRGKEGHS